MANRQDNDPLFSSTSSSHPPAKPSPEEIVAAHATLYAAGYHIRSQVLGPDYVSRSLATNSDSFSAPIVSLATTHGWGTVWTRPDLLPLKTRSFITMAMLAALGKPHELSIHVKGALRNGCSEEEIREVLLQVCVYAGFPAGIEGTRVAKAVIEEWRKQGDGGKEHS